MTFGLITTGPQGGPQVDGSYQRIIPNAPPQSPISLVAREVLDEASNTFERQLSVAGIHAPCRVTYGTDRLGAVLLNAWNYGTSLLVAVSWGRGRIQGVSNVYIGNQPMPASVLATHYLGSTSQAVDAKLVTALAGVSITHTNAFPGLAYSVFEFPVGADLGEITAQVDGLWVYDPRDGTQTLGVPTTYKWSDNPALHLADAITNTIYGLGKAIDWTSVTAAANACDALVSGEKKYRSGYTLDTRMAADTAVEILRAQAGCFVVRSGGVYKLVPDAPASSVMTITKAEIVQGSQQWSTRDIEDLPNVVEVEYTDRTVVPWTPRTARYPTNGLPPAGQDLRLSRIQMPGTFRYSEALRIAIERVNHANLESLEESFDTYLKALPLEVGDVYTLNDGGLSGGITYRLLSSPYGSSQKGVLRLSGRKYDPAAFDSSAVAAPTTGNTTLPSAGSPPTVGPLTLTESIATTPNGAVPLSTINVSFASLVWPFLSGYRIVIRDGTGAQVDEALVNNAPTTTAWQSKPLPVYSTYTVEVRARSSFAESATASSDSITLTGAGVAALATVYSIAINRSGLPGWFLDGVEAFQLYQGDTVLRLRTEAAAEPSMASVYPGANMLTPGQATMMLDADRATGTVYPTSWTAISPTFDMLTQRTAVYAVLNVARWAQLYFKRLRFTLRVSDTPGFAVFSEVDAPSALLTGRYVQIRLATFSLSSRRYFWQIEFDQSTIAQMMPTTVDPLSATTSATEGVVVRLPRRYITANVLGTARSSSNVAVTVSNLTLSETDLNANTVQVHAYDGATRVAVPVDLQITGAPAL